MNDETILKEHIYPNMKENYYWSNDFSSEFYIKAAQCGFITTSMYKDDGNFVLLPEIQFDYAILDFEDIKVPRKVKRLLKQNNYTLSINNRFYDLVEKIKHYHDDSWMKDEYIDILKDINKNNNLETNFKLISVELVENETNELISGEIGYQVGSTYTSLSGFTTRDKKYNNWGKLQLVLLNDFLKQKGFKFWNLGHPQLQYKIDLGAKIYNRDEFLSRWKDAI